MITVILSLVLAMGGTSFRTESAQITIDTTARVDFFQDYSDLDTALEASRKLCEGSDVAYAERHVSRQGEVFWTVSCEFDN